MDLSQLINALIRLTDALVSFYDESVSLSNTLHSP
jgi:hypothetical protein